ncbi:hypothetical protein IWX90DRAFT_100391 [Phyllosticta citrichinensis]|uniref:Secreted protein n=1 Tax=Phyllosticta citrichinensis TaxID=1130410 RepID=A0ABR1Y1T9_9PEZI
MMGLVLIPGVLVSCSARALSAKACRRRAQGDCRQRQKRTPSWEGGRRKGGMGYVEALFYINPPSLSTAESGNHDPRSARGPFDDDVPPSIRSSVIPVPRPVRAARYPVSEAEREAAWLYVWLARWRGEECQERTGFWAVRRFGDTPPTLVNPPSACETPVSRIHSLSERGAVSLMP